MIHQPEPGSQPPDGRPWREQPGWRLDFPIDWPRDHFVARRDFIKFLCLTSLGFAFGQVCLLLDSVGSEKRSGELAVGKLSELPIGKTVPFGYPTPKDPCLLTRVDETTLVAHSQLCTHLSCPVVPQTEKGRYYCPCHEGAFDLASGRPLMGPPRRPLPRIVLEVRGDTIYATGVERST